MRGRSYSPSPPRGYSRRGRSPSPRGRHGGRGRDLPTSLLVRNLRHDCRPEDLRRPFEQFGALKDIYLPRDYYTGEPRGFGFVQYSDPHDAAEAKHHMDGRVLLGRELTVVFAEENRKKPVDMRARESTRGRFRDRRRSPPRYSRSPRHSRSPPPHHASSRSHSRDYYSPPPKRRHHSRGNLLKTKLHTYLPIAPSLIVHVLAFYFEADLFQPKRGDTVKGGHIHDQGAAAKLQLGIRAGARAQRKEIENFVDILVKLTLPSILVPCEPLQRHHVLASGCFAVRVLASGFFQDLRVSGFWFDVCEVLWILECLCFLFSTIMCLDLIVEIIVLLFVYAEKIKASVEAMKLQLDCAFWSLVFLIAFFLCLKFQSYVSGAFVGINIGTDVVNMPSAPDVVAILKANKISHVRLYDADAHMLKALADSGIEVMVGVTNEEVLGIGESPSKAAAWINQNVAAYLPSTNITAIAVGSEVLTSIPNVVPVLVPAMNYLHKALVASNLNYQVKVSTPQAMDILQFLKNTNSYYMLNAYPYFGYTSGNGIFPLDYALFRSLPSVKQIVDPNTLSHYDSMFDAMVDAAYYSIEALNMSGIPIVVTETGWPWLGGANEPDATADNAETFNNNLIRRVLNDSGPPSQPNFPINTYIYELFNEDKRPGPVSEKNWGLFFTNGSAVYSFSLSTSNGITGNNSDFCVAKPNADPGKLQKGLNWACGEGGANCSAIQEGRPCYLPNTYQNHASYAYNDYYQKSVLPVQHVTLTVLLQPLRLILVMDPVNLLGGENLNLLVALSKLVNILKQFNCHSDLEWRIYIACGTWTCESSRREWNYEHACFENSISNISSGSCSSLALTPGSFQFCILLGDLTSAEDHQLIEND
ncbi:unnamed protein product [Dovyalis caffra]|uniref:glucan endo-1,3-beta-D-glucosidase n=1 Tax=Dovyalis caffra TaxID=77055 RepID=A0AAV1RTR2_9ROSI|nr:unnamed protein product [Dovyalis caffra]